MKISELWKLYKEEKHFQAVQPVYVKRLLSSIKCPFRNIVDLELDEISLSVFIRISGTRDHALIQLDEQFVIGRTE